MSNDREQGPPDPAYKTSGKQDEAQLPDTTAVRSGCRSNSLQSASGSEARDRPKADQCRCRTARASPAPRSLSAPPQDLYDAASDPAGCAFRDWINRIVGPGQCLAAPSSQCPAAENHPADGIIIRPKSRVLFQQHRSKADMPLSPDDVCLTPKSGHRLTRSLRSPGQVLLAELRAPVPSRS